MTERWVIEVNHSLDCSSIAKDGDSECDCSRSWKRVSKSFLDDDMKELYGALRYRQANDSRYFRSEYVPMEPESLEVCVYAVKKFHTERFPDTQYRIRKVGSDEIIPVDILG